MTDPQSRHEPGRLIGREREVALVAERLIGSRLVTIAGLGGIGKTSLVREVTTRRETAGDRSFFVDLASVAEARRVAAAIATVTGAAEDPDTKLDLLLAGIDIRSRSALSGFRLRLHHFR
jgi:predicted ATPase